MQRLEVSGAERPIYGSLGLRRLESMRQDTARPRNARSLLQIDITDLPRQFWSLLKQACH